MKKVLYVERDNLCKHLFRGCLEHVGWTVVTGSSSDEGLVKAESERPDVIITGVALLASSGYDLCRRIRRHEDKAVSSLPIIILSWLERPEDIGQGKRAGADAYFTKPVDFIALRSWMEEIA